MRLFVLCTGLSLIVNFFAYGASSDELGCHENKSALWQKLESQISGAELAEEVSGLDPATQRLFSAAKSGSLTDLQQAISEGANQNQQLYGMTAAVFASQRGHFELAEQLLPGTADFDHAFIDAARAFAEAKRARTEMLMNTRDGFLVESKVELEFLRACMIHLSATVVRSDFYYFMLYKAFSRIVQLNGKPSICMLCLNDRVKIAGSHYISKGILQFISSHWITPDVNTIVSASSMTLPLFCTASKKSDLRCEQRLAQYGESDMAAKFLPFIATVQELMAKGEGGASLHYESWLYHTVTSLAYRVFLSDLENQDNWLTKLERDPMLRLSRGAMWKTIETLRKYLMDHEKPSSHRIFLFLSENGLRKDGEHALVHGIGSGFNGEWHHFALFSILGFHFVVVQGDEAYSAFKEILDNCDGFVHEVTPAGGTINIDMARDGFLLPELVRGKLAAFNQAWADDMGHANFNRIHEDQRKKKIVIAAQDFGTPPLVSPKRLVLLPKFLSFIPGAADAGFHAGNIVSSNQFVVLKSFSEFPDEGFCAWVFHHEKGKYWFTITHLKTDDNEIVFGHEFDPHKATKDVFLQSATEEGFVPDLGLKPLRGSDSDGIYFDGDNGATWFVGRCLLDYVFGATK